MTTLAFVCGVIIGIALTGLGVGILMIFSDGRDRHGRR
jgi:hypothetical protein